MALDTYAVVMWQMADGSLGIEPSPVRLRPDFYAIDSYGRHRGHCVHTIPRGVRGLDASAWRYHLNMAERIVSGPEVASLANADQRATEQGTMLEEIAADACNAYLQGVRDARAARLDEHPSGA